MVDRSGQIWAREMGVPQGGVISPLLANLFLHYGLDLWLQRNHSSKPFARYADDAVIHCVSAAEADRLIRELAGRLAEIGLALHPEKTRKVYVGRGAAPIGAAREFTFLGYDFRQRTLRDREGRLFRRIAPGAAKSAMKAMTKTIRSWRIHRSTCGSLNEFARRYNSTLRGWITYYGRYWYRNFSYRLWGSFQSRLVKWVMSKYRLSRRRAERRLGRIRRSHPKLFAHWHLLSGQSPHPRAV